MHRGGPCSGRPDQVSTERAHDSIANFSSDFCSDDVIGTSTHLTTSFSGKRESEVALFAHARILLLH